MAIDVTCPGCKTRFQVSDKFAGKKGPCPKCKTTIEIPSAKDQVIIHAPEPTGPVDSKGKAVLEPIFREEVSLAPPVIFGIVASVLVVLAMALVLGLTAEKRGKIEPVLTILGAIVLAPPLVFAGYTFLRDQEAAPHRGMELVVRLIAPSLVYPLLWGLYWAVFAYFGVTDKPPELMFLLIAAAAMVVLGALTAQASLELDFGPAAMHYALYLAATVILRVIMGMNAYWNVVS
ncbi:MAG: zinc-ribbon domain-containing protein [Planctomycetaceae bacterium]|nr:zinc-ribbon domain-containing protein [Planctomycetaceae bacterium]